MLIYHARHVSRELVRVEPVGEELGNAEHDALQAAQLALERRPRDAESGVLC